MFTPEPIISFSTGEGDGYRGIPQGTALSPVGSRPTAISPPTRVLISPHDWLGNSASTTAAASRKRRAR